MNCIDCGTAEGVEPRWPGYGSKLYLRCEACGEKRIARERENIRRNNPDGPCAPDGFDPDDAGESWGEP
jgi:DNA-directed RNA polymerase subunit RPC12/RpoP